MRCPFCKADKANVNVVDSRDAEAGFVVRRRRRCELCKRRWTTYERMEDGFKLMVIKRDGRREPFDRNKIINSIRRACTKLDIDAQQIDRIVEDVETEVYTNFDREVPSSFIGGRTAERLKSVSQVAYVRFASVYRKFTDVTEFIAEAEKVAHAGFDAPGQKMLFDVITRLRNDTPATSPAGFPLTGETPLPSREGAAQAKTPEVRAPETQIPETTIPEEITVRDTHVVKSETSAARSTGKSSAAKLGSRGKNGSDYANDAIKLTGTQLSETVHS